MPSVKWQATQCGRLHLLLLIYVLCNYVLLDQPNYLSPEIEGEDIIQWCQNKGSNFYKGVYVHFSFIYINNGKKEYGEKSIILEET